MLSNETVSVALCTHNGARYVREQVTSILAQTLLPIEIVVSDDASSDDTLAIIRSTVAEWAASGLETSVQLVVLENTRPLGVTANFEQAIRATSGSLVALCDQDDRWRSDRLESATAQFTKRADLDLLFTDARLIDGDGGVLPATLLSTLEVGPRDRSVVHSGEALKLFIRRNLATGATVMFRRGVLTEALPFPRTWVHDEWLATLTACLGRVDLLDEALVDYRQHTSNQIGVVSPTLKRKISRVFEPRGARNALIAAKFQDLADRLRSLGDRVPAEVLRSVSEKVDAETSRAALPSNRLARIPWIFRALERKWYANYFSQGWRDVFRDLLQPH